MGRYMNRIGEVTIMEVLDIDVPKKRKICDLFRLKSHNGVADMLPGLLVSPAVSLSDEPAGSSTSCCSSYSKSLDLNENSVEVKEKEKMSSSQERREEFEKPESKETPENESPPRRVREILPSREEFDAFFARHEKEMLKRFREKYNFDCEKEEPLEGRYKWVKIHED